MNDKEVKKLTRWQLRVNEELENKIRLLALKEHRSINQTLIYIAEIYFEIVEREEKEKD